VKLPQRLTLHNVAFALDGGTTYLSASDEAGRGHTVMLVQHSRPEPSPYFDALPGRLYFDGQLVPMRSEWEAGILSLLRSAEVRYGRPLPQESNAIPLSPNALIIGDDIREVLTRGPEENIRALTARVIGFVESDEYLLFAERVGQAADPTRYDVWVVWDPENFNRAVVRTRQLLGLGMREAKEFVEQGGPVACGVRAPEVIAWAQRYHEAGLDVRVSPEFRWKLP
jgi:hypothetical protein